MMQKPRVLILAWLPEGMLARLTAEFPELEIVDGRPPADFERHFANAVITYGLPPVARLSEAKSLRWIQLISAGVPHEICAPAMQRGLTITNLAGLYGPSIAEHAFALMLMLARNLPAVIKHQPEHHWDRDVARSMSDLHGRTLGIVGLGNIGQHVARLGRAFGMRVVGCRRSDKSTACVDQLYPLANLHTMLSEVDYLVIAAPLTPSTEGMLGRAEFAAVKRGAVYVNISRGPVAQEEALRAALASGHLAGAGLDVYAVEPLPADHPFWTMPKVIVSPHVSGEVVNNSSLPAERFARNLRCWLAQQPLEGVVNLELGY